MPRMHINPIEVGMVSYLMDVAKMDGKHFAQKKAETMCKVLQEIIDHSDGGESLHVLKDLVGMIELAVL